MWWNGCRRNGSLFCQKNGKFASSTFKQEAQPAEYDIVIYGGTSAGIAAAIQSSRMGKTVLLNEPTQRIGGLTTGGLGQTDIGNKNAIGGISREFYQNIRKYYEDPAHWKWQEREEYMDGGQTRTAEGEDAMWTFEPSAALQVYKDMIDAEKIELVYGERLNREDGVKKNGSAITQIEMESGATYEGKMFIDVTYEGDLMAAAGVSYHVGREANSVYGETYNGVQLLEGHQFPDGVDPYVTPSDPASGLLWGISNGELAEQGSGDTLVQAYNFRICLTNDEDNKIPITEPENYDSKKYELLARLFEAQPDKRRLNNYFIWSHMPNEKTDINNRGGFSTDMINMSHAYPEGSYEEREAIFKAHIDYTKGLLYFYTSDARVPKELQEEVRNLLVPVCLSASHIAFGSIRMEPVFMVLGQSAATAASLAIDQKVNIHDLEYEKLRKTLLENKQRLEPAKQN